MSDNVRRQRTTTTNDDNERRHGAIAQIEKFSSGRNVTNIFKHRIFFNYPVAVSTTEKAGLLERREYHRDGLILFSKHETLGRNLFQYLK